MFNSQLKELKSTAKYKTEVILRLSSSKIGNSNDEANFPLNLLLFNEQVANLCKALTNNIKNGLQFCQLI